MDLIINLNKPRGITSLHAVTKIKRLFGVSKAGHTGTLDPMATGVLLVCLNEATKISRFLLDMDKRYHARVKLGEFTDTGDAEGRVIEQKDASSVTEEEVSRVVRMFEGEINQRPPMYSAVKINGQKLYKLARKGLEIDRPERAVRIHNLQITGVDLPYFDLSISCSKGTYVRTLCEDIGKVLGVGAHLTALERSAVGFFKIIDSACLDELADEDFFEKNKSFSAIDEALSQLKEVFLDEKDYERAKNGVPIKVPEINGLHDNYFLRLKGPAGNLFGIGRIDNDLIRIERILNI